MAPYEALGRRAQVDVMRAHALEVLRHYPVDVAGLRLVLHGFNTTFRVDTPSGTRFALRINVNSHRSLDQIRVEQQWIAALAADTTVPVAAPLPNRAGNLLTVLRNERLARTLPAVLSTWLPGRDLGSDATLRHMREVGSLMARLHEHTATWPPDRPGSLVVADRTLLDLADNFSGRHDLFDAAALDVLTRTRQSVDAHLRDLYAQSSPQLIHQDLHNSNIRVTEGRLAVLDFDDCGFGLPAQDLAVSAYYLRDNVRQENALLEGYAAVRSLPHCTADQFESLLAGRNLLLLNDVLTISTADLRAMIPRYAHNTVVKLRNWLDTGRYRHEVSGLAE